ncbi:hypothetical protein M404DRAFT_995701 [Pisolithus tinctorius Marx 270]|uniref:Uncharacterized protein n=1 Tax=Pisolithus tinctorius Marx 270 TaxID=870435 RepID=A0A0C3PA84_PISTI|nr:hypothetical protein M404DRAFT_995701 [Pisolithus tinctorius Marx 270]
MDGTGVLEWHSHRITAVKSDGRKDVLLLFYHMCFAGVNSRLDRWHYRSAGVASAGSWQCQVGVFHTVKHVEDLKFWRRNVGTNL